MSDRVRVLRVIEYFGERAWVERTVAKSIQGTMVVKSRDGKPIAEIRAATIGTYPELLENLPLSERKPDEQEQ